MSHFPHRSEMRCADLNLKKNIYKYYSIKPTLDILHSLLWDGPLRKKHKKKT